MSERVLVCGGRGYTDYLRFCLSMREVLKEKPALIIHGSAPGADFCAAVWARDEKIPQQPFPADWKTHGKAAGPLRNQRMIDEGKPDLVIAFPGGRGTADMTKRARLAGIPVIAVEQAGK